MTALPYISRRHNNFRSNSIEKAEQDERNTNALFSVLFQVASDCIALKKEKSWLPSTDGRRSEACLARRLGERAPTISRSQRRGREVPGARAAALDAAAAGGQPTAAALEAAWSALSFENASSIVRSVYLQYSAKMRVHTQHAWNS